MDGNKDEALKCLRIGRQALDLGDRIRALKFITKARRLDPNLPVDDLLSSLEGESRDAPDQNSGPGDGEFTSSKPNGGSSSARIRVPSNGSSSSSSSSSRSYTEEQILIVKQIKKQKDYYEILGVERTCSVEEVRKAYRKLSLKVHPDKNKAPGSEEAFKAVSKAFQCLSDEERRKSYDLLGSEEVVHERSAARRGQHGFNGFYDADVDAEEIFRNFFFGGMPRATTQFSGFSFGTGMGPSVRRADHGHSHGSGSFNPWALVQLLPILLVFLLNLLPSSEPIYALSRFYPYEHQFVTQKGVNYYVKEAKFEHDYPPDSQNRVALEDRVEREYFSLLAQNCQAELQRFHWGYIRETPQCDKLKQFKFKAVA